MPEFVSFVTCASVLSAVASVCAIMQAERIQFPAMTGAVARLLNTVDDKLAYLIRARRIRPSPPVTNGRRLWQPAHIAAAAKALGVPVPLEVQELVEAGQ